MTADRRAAEEELGDLLFVVVNLARFLGFDPEVALKHSNLKFKFAFKQMEKKRSISASNLPSLSKEELEILWDAAKADGRDRITELSAMTFEQ